MVEDREAVGGAGDDGGGGVPVARSVGKATFRQGLGTSIHSSQRGRSAASARTWPDQASEHLAVAAARSAC